MVGWKMGWKIGSFTLFGVVEKREGEKGGG